MKRSHTLLLAALALLAPACNVVSAVPVIPIVPPGVHVRPEVARGYAAYASKLVAWGSWLPDSTHGVLWCPSAAATGGEPFQPYLNRGHWEASEAPIGKAPAGSPVWRSEDSATWGEITSHHGWWVRVSSDGPSPWCWVPGAEETAARVLWREADGFVGWAPEPPLWIVCDEVDYENNLDWAFTLLGTLLDALPDQNQLTGQAREQARSSTAPGHAPNGAFQKQHVGPKGSNVAAARETLADYVVKHPNAFAATNASTGGGGNSGAKGGSNEGSSSSGGKKKSSSDDKEKAKTAENAPFPTAMQYYDAFLAEPPLGPPGLVPGSRSTAMAASGAAKGSAGSTGSAVSALEGAHAHGRSEALHVTEGAHGGGSAGSGAVGSAPTGSYSYGSSGASSHSSGHGHSSGKSSHSGHHK